MIIDDYDFTRFRGMTQYSAKRLFDVTLSIIKKQRDGDHKTPLRTCFFPKNSKNILGIASDVISLAISLGIICRCIYHGLHGIAGIVSYVTIVLWRDFLNAQYTIPKMGHDMVG